MCMQATVNVTDKNNKIAHTMDEHAGIELLVLGVFDSASTVLSNVSVVTCVARSRSPNDCVLLVVAAYWGCLLHMYCVECLVCF